MRVRTAARTGDFRRTLLAYALVALGACLVAAPIASADAPAAANDQYNPNPGGGGGNGGGNGAGGGNGGGHHHHHHKASLTQKCHNKSYRKHHRKACHKALLHRAGGLAAVSAATASSTGVGSSGAAVTASNAAVGSSGTAATSGAQAGDPGAAGSEAESGGGSLPFTGYPVTTLVWIMIGLVGAGLAIRFGWAAWERRRDPAV